MIDLKEALRWNQEWFNSCKIEIPPRMIKEGWVSTLMKLTGLEKELELMLRIILTYMIREIENLNKGLFSRL